MFHTYIFTAMALRERFIDAAAQKSIAVAALTELEHGLGLYCPEDLVQWKHAEQAWLAYIVTNRRVPPQMESPYHTVDDTSRFSYVQYEHAHRDMFSAISEGRRGTDTRRRRTRRR